MLSQSSKEKVGLSVFLTLVFTVFLYVPCFAQVMRVPQQRSQALHLPVYLPSGSLDPNVPLSLMPGFPIMPDTQMLMDNFEYWDSPLNHGWQKSDPAYPVWGFGVGYGNFQTIIDFQEGSRILEVSRPSTVFMPQMERYVIWHELPGNGLRGSFSVLSLKMKSNVVIEEFDRYEIAVLCNEGTLEFRLVPIGTEQPCPVYDPESTATSHTETISTPSGTVNKTVVTATIGKENADGTWHWIMVDLQRMADNAGAPAINVINTLLVYGNSYRMDDIKFMTASAVADLKTHKKPPNLFRVNHLYTQLYDTTRRYLFGSDDIADRILITKEFIGVTGTGLTGELAEENAQLWINDIDAGLLAQFGIKSSADIPGLNSALYKNTIIPSLTLADGSPLPEGGLAILKLENPTTLLNVPVLGATLPASLLYPLDVPLLRDPMMRMGGFMSAVCKLKFLWFVGANPVTDITLTEPFPMENLSTTDPFQPAYHPLWRTSSPLTGNPYLTSPEIEMIRMALLQAGYPSWPTIAFLEFTEQSIEQMFTHIFVTNGAQVDVETFMVVTTNYPVTNYPPVFQDVHDQVMYVGKGPQSYQVSAVDADSFTISMAMGEGFKPDIEQLTYKAFINGLPSYMYGPWVENIINPKTGLITIDPKFEGMYEMVVTARDPKGAEAMTSLMLHCVNPQSWFNHAPVVVFDIETDPIFMIAGNEFVLSGIEVVDPDGEQLYYSSNIGSVSVDAEGNPIWTFHTVYEGAYQLAITAYDETGGFCIIPHMVMVMPWWTPCRCFPVPLY
ncbi:MAG: hypothetical protein ACMUJM_19745 [bacterium]